MSAFLTARISPALLTVVCVLALLAAACAPAATPTPTAAPTSAPVEEEAEPTGTAVEEEATEAAEEEAEPTEAEVGEETEAAEEEAESTEAADVTETADEADATEAASSDAAAGEGMPGVVGVTSTRVRETPSVRGTVIIEIPVGTEVLALGQTANEGYLFIRLADGTEGWVSKQTINLEDRFADLPLIEPES